MSHNTLLEFMSEVKSPHITSCHMRTHCDNYGRFNECNEVTVICDQYKGQCKKVGDAL